VGVWLGEEGEGVEVTGTEENSLFLAGRNPRFGL